MIIHDQPLNSLKSPSPRLSSETSLKNEIITLIIRQSDYLRMTPGNVPAPTPQPPCVSCGEASVTVYPRRRWNGQPDLQSPRCCYMCYRLAMVYDDAWRRVIHDHVALDQVLTFAPLSSNEVTPTLDGLPAELTHAINQSLCKESNLRIYGRWQPRRPQRQPRFPVVVDVPLPLGMTMAEAVFRLKANRATTDDTIPRGTSAFHTMPHKANELTEIIAGRVPSECTRDQEPETTWLDYWKLDRNMTIHHSWSEWAADIVPEDGEILDLARAHPAYHLRLAALLVPIY